MKFPDNFIWGAAAASYQIEGAVHEGGRGKSVWDTFCRQSGKVLNGDTGDTACNHYHHYREDVRLMAEIGLKAYRLSISWPRVLPEGSGRINETGLAFYDRLIDALLEHDITPWVTLFHWDYPVELSNRGGWLNRDSADWFADYTQVVVARLSDRVRHWMTINEPQCFIDLGHRVGEHAPGLKLGLEDLLLAAHHSLLAHGKAVQVIRVQAKITPTIGAAPVGVVKMPLSDHPEEVAFARDAMFSVTSKDCWNNTWFSDPMIFGRYPEDGLELMGKELPEIKEGDMQTIAQPLDFYGVNIYHGQYVQPGDNRQTKSASVPIGPPLTTMGWQVTPEALYWGPRFLYERYNLPIVVTENGMANTDWIQVDGKVRDPQRVDYLQRYLGQLKRAIDDGVEAKGYFYWSVMDNYEWALGYMQRFGLVHVDYATEKRTPKESAWWYRELIRNNGETLA